MDEGFRLPPSWGEALRDELEQRLAGGESVDITVAMTGRLIPDESVVYDFSHDQEGLGVIMPVVKLERLDYLLRPHKSDLFH